MKVRTDFVSNSSSSSFICSSGDMVDETLFSTSQILSLHEYLEMFGEVDVLGDTWFGDFHEKDMKFVDDKTYARMFACSISKTLPNSAKHAYLENPREWSVLMPYVEAALAPWWGNVTFEYVEGEDCNPRPRHNNRNADDEDYDATYSFDNEEDYLTNLFERRKMKFSRVFNNH